MLSFRPRCRAERRPGQSTRPNPVSSRRAWQVSSLTSIHDGHDLDFLFSCQTTWTVLSVFRRQIAFFFFCAHNVWMGRDRLRHVFQPKWLTTNTTWADCFFFFAQEDPDLHSKHTPGPDIDLDPASPASTPGWPSLVGSFDARPVALVRTRPGPNSQLGREAVCDVISSGTNK